MGIPSRKRKNQFASLTIGIFHHSMRLSKILSTKNTVIPIYCINESSWKNEKADYSINSVLR